MNRRHLFRGALAALAGLSFKATALEPAPTEPMALLMAHMQDGSIVELGRVPLYRLNNGVALHWPEGTKHLTMIAVGPIDDWACPGPEGA